MLKKSIPVILGALLLGTNAEAVVFGINCPRTVNTSFVKNGIVEESGLSFQLNPNTQVHQILTFVNRSSTPQPKTGLSQVYCSYADTKGRQFTLEAQIKLPYCIIPNGPFGPTNSCEGIPSCAKIVCKQNP